MYGSRNNVVEVHPMKYNNTWSVVLIGVSKYFEDVFIFGVSKGLNKTLPFPRSPCIDLVFVAPSQVHKSSWYMLHYGGPTPKRHYAFANSRHVAAFNAGSLRGWAKQKKSMQELGKTHELVDKYRDGNGQLRWKGNKRLRSSELETHFSHSHIVRWVLESIFCKIWMCFPGYIYADAHQVITYILGIHVDQSK